MAIDSEKLYEFKKNLRRLRGFQGSGTEMISVYIGSGSPLHDTTGKLREEMGQASNIKSKSTKTNVTGALERILGYLKIYKSTPKNGIAIFCGNVSDNPAKIEIELFPIEPPMPLNISAYRCDSKFFLEPLDEMIQTKDVYGILVMDGKDATLAILRGKNTEIVDKIISLAPSKVNKGGQSQRRIERLVEESKEYYYKKIGESVSSCFLGKVKGMIVGGPGPVKDYFLKMSPFNYQIKVLGIVDTGYTDEYGVREALAKSESIISEHEAIREKTLIDNFIKEISKNGLAVYGYKQVKEVISTKQAGKVLISEDLEDKVNYYACNCGASEEIISKEKQLEKIRCQKCSNEMKLDKVVMIVDELIDLAKNANIDIEMVSNKTVEGAQFLTGFGGIGAFLRYRK